MRNVRLLLASAPHADTFGYSMPPPGLLRLGGELRRQGFEVALEDLAFRLAAGELPPGDHLARASAALLAGRGEFNVIGLSTMGATLPAALAIARELRERSPRVRLVLGGPGTGGVDHALLERFPHIDAVVRGEGELTLPALLRCWELGVQPEGVAGITWRDAQGTVCREADRAPMQLSEVAPYAWDLLPALTKYKAITGEPEGLTPIDSGRGCVYDCSFCSIGRYWGRRSRALPAAQLAREVRALADHAGARQAYLCHDLFGAQRDQALEFCSLVEGSGVPWECRARLDHLDPELYAAMARAGCYRVLLGVESADPVVRRRNQKGMPDQVDLLAGVDACRAAGITPILSLILGLPGEDEAGLARSLDFCAEAALRPGVNLSLHLANPQPGCALGDEFGPDSKSVPGIPPDMAWGAGQSAPERDLIEAHPDLFSSWHLLPWDEARLRDLRTIATELPEVLMRYPRTFAVLRRRHGEGSLALYRRWQASERSFEAFALTSNDILVNESLEWERIQVRAAARGARKVQALEPERGAHATLELLTAHHDLAALTPALISGSPLPPPGAARTFGVQAVPGIQPGVRTLRLAPGVARILNELGGDDSLAELERRRPGLTDALSRLADAGLVTAT
jgi:radical SAM superfamily enzyme YgiQ (UPF0313 family)